MVSRKPVCNVYIQNENDLRQIRWFSPVSSANKTDRHDIIEILLKVALKTITLTRITMNNKYGDGRSGCHTNGEWRALKNYFFLLCYRFLSWYWIKALMGYIYKHHFNNRCLCFTYISTIKDANVIYYIWKCSRRTPRRSDNFITPLLLSHARAYL